MQKVKLLIKAVSYSQTHSGAYALRLREENGNRELPIVIGGFEAQSIAVALDKKNTPPRPLTHDLFKNFATAFEIHLKEVLISKLVDGVFHATLVCEQQGKVIEIDARTSDAVALAIRFQAEIYTTSAILEQAGVVLDDEYITPATRAAMAAKEAPMPESTSGSYANQTLEELYDLLDLAVDDEDYELAARIRDEISKRSPNA
jgi:uncharacterized protein